MIAGDDRDRIRGALLGLAVGDALGAPLEAAAPSVAVAVVDHGLEMTGGGWWAPGEWTDDTASRAEKLERPCPRHAARLG